MRWATHLRTIQRSLKAIRVAAAVVLAEQLYEVLVLGISLAEHPIIVIAALGALGFPKPSSPPEQQPEGDGTR